MTEMKATTIYDAYWKANSVGEGTGILVYLKSEADKVISELEESHKMEVEQLLIEIVKLKDNSQNVSATLKETREWLVESQKLHKRCADNAVKVIRHQKYKRCLAMAEMCNARYDAEDAKVNGCGASWEYINKEMKYWERWRQRWLELAKKSKEAK